MTILKTLTKSIHPSWHVVMLCAGIISGAIAGVIFHVNFFSSGLWYLFAALLFISVLLVPKAIFLFIAFLAGVILIFTKISTETYGADYIKQFINQTIEVTGQIDGDPETDDSATKIKLKNLKLGDHQTPGTIYLTLRQNHTIARADIITVVGKLAEGFSAYSGYMYKPTLKNIARPDPGDLILKVRNHFAERIQKLIPAPNSNLGLSYLLGMKSNLPDDLSENLRLVGLVHIVVASGAHLSILVEVARKIFGKLSRFSGLLFSILFIIFFMSMVGFTPSILRAGIMSILTLLTWYVGRKFAPWRIILIVAAITLMINPSFLLNLGWLLSFASYAGIMMLGPALTKFFYGDQKPGFIASIILTTIAATIMTLPIILYYYGTISLISVFANLLILPTLPYAMGLVFLTGVFSGLPIIELVISFLATKLLDFHIAVVNFFAGQKSFLIAIEPQKSVVFLIYFLIFIPLLIREIYQIKRKHAIINSCQDTVNGPLPNVKKPS